MITKIIPDFDPRKIADSGQCFRMNRLKEGTYSVVAFDRYLEITDLGGGGFTFSCSEEDFKDIWTEYFDLSSDYSALRTMIPPADTFLMSAVDFGWGMRILNQDPWEVTVSFIISQRKSIPAIKTAIETICFNYGIKMESGTITYYSFPSPERLAELDCSHLSSCSLGYRDKYIISSAQSIAGGRLRLADLRRADEDTARTALKSLYGVGEKVANCILLFGLHHTNAFPEDVWIKRIIDTEYGGSFPKSRYDGYLGIVQQFIFYYARSREYQSPSHDVDRIP